MSCDHPSECEQCASRIRKLELDLLAERDLRIGNLAKLGRSEWELAQVQQALALSPFRRYVVTPLKSVPMARRMKQRLLGSGSSA